jgi:hypothetical protein
MATNNGIYFNGRWIIHPGAYGGIDASAMTSMSTGSQKIIALIGTSKGGIPGEVMWFTDPTAAKKTLKGGYLLKAAQKAWGPNSAAQGAYTIACIRANQAIQSLLPIGDEIPVVASIGPAVKAETNASTGVVTSSGTYTGTTDVTIEIIIDSADSDSLTNVTFGWRYSGENWKAEKITVPSDGSAVSIENGIKVTFGPGSYKQNSVWKITATSKKDNTTVGTIVSADYGAWTKKIQCKMEDGTKTGTKMFTTNYYEDYTIEVIDNIGACFYLRYTGTQPYARVNIEHDASGKAVSLTTKIGVDESHSIIDLNIDLTDTRFSGIRELVDYISQYENYSCRSYAVVSSGIKATDLDAVDSKDILTEEVLLCSIWKDLEIQLNSLSKLVKFNRTAYVSGPPKNFDYINLSGGSDGVTPSSWLSYFDLLSTYEINYVVPLTGDEAIIAEAKEHVNYVSTNMGRERSLKVGGNAGESVEQTQARALSYSSDRVQLAYPGFYDTNEYGEQELYPPFITAAMLAGRQAYLDIGESATFNYFNVVSLEKNLNPTEVNSLITSGVATFEYVINKGYRLAQDITTYTNDTISLYTERSVRDLADSLNKELRTKIEEEIIGKKGVVTNVESIKNLTISFLQQKIRDSVIVAYKNVSVRYTNRVIYVDYGGAPVEPVNFALISGHFYTADQITA